MALGHPLGCSCSLCRSRTRCRAATCAGHHMGIGGGMGAAGVFGNLRGRA
ncbi:MAG: hypothetical protein KDD73_12225 [Anaerolineales bacterium]|nr:hypothetical protein [Anaerolineales bacterium]